MYTADAATITPPPPTRVPDLSDLDRDERAELRDYIDRLKRAGGFDPGTIRLTLSPEEIARLRTLEGRVRWAVPMPARRAERPATATNDGTGGIVLMPTRVAQKRHKNAVSDLMDATERLALLFDTPMPVHVDPQRDPDGVQRLELCSRYLTTLAGRLEQAQPAMQIGA
jgi:hypothetical protein